MEKQRVSPKYINSIRYVKSRDLNHHGSLFAGTIAEWLFETAFFTATSLLRAEKLLFLKVNEMNCKKPIYPGGIIHYKSKLVYAGKSSITIYVIASEQGTNDVVADGFVSYVHVDEKFHSLPHQIELNLESDEDVELAEIAKSFRKKS